MIWNFKVKKKDKTYRINQNSLFHLRFIYDVRQSSSYLHILVTEDYWMSLIVQYSLWFRLDSYISFVEYQTKSIADNRFIDM